MGRGSVALSFNVRQNTPLALSPSSPLHTSMRAVTAAAAAIKKPLCAYFVPRC